MNHLQLTPIPVAKAEMRFRGVIAINGWANRLLLIMSAVWVMTVGWLAFKLGAKS